MEDHIIRALVEKGILAESDLSGGATLTPEQKEELADLTIEASALKDHATFEKIYSEWEHNSIELAGRYAEIDRGSTSGGRLPSTYKLSLKPVPLKAVLRLQREYLRYLATKRIAPDKKAEIFAAALGTVLSNDSERMIYSSNTLGPSVPEATFKNDGTGHATDRVKDDTFSEFNGIIAAADASGSEIASYNAANSSDIRVILHNLIVRVPADYRMTGKDEFRFYMPSNMVQNLIGYLEKRQTTLGDDLILTADGQVKFRGFLIADCPLFDLNPTVTEHVTMNGTTAVNLLYKPIPSASDFFANAPTLAGTAATPYVGGGTDYTLNITNGTVTTPGSGAIGNTSVVKFTYKVLPQIFFTKKSNFIIGVGVDDMEMESQYFANPGVLELVGRTRIAYGFVKEAWVSRAYNVQDAVTAS